ncbi:hypothetical protein N9003_01505 [bacterium]|nr:hypothetical protein [bacterium]
MNHPAELAIYSFLQKALAGEANMTEAVTKQVAADVEAALNKQFNSPPRGDFRLRMSNIGKAPCQLWFEKNDPEDRRPFPPHFLMNMILGDIVEAVFKGLLRSVGQDFKDNDVVTLKLPNGQEIKGEYDMLMDGKIDDVKSSSPWGYKNKFESFATLNNKDSFGYVSQLVGYAEAAGAGVGGWWVVNKGNGEFKYVDASEVDKEAVIDSIQSTVDYIENDEPFKRCYEAVPETYFKKPSGNLVLDADTCGWCDFKHKCWDLKEQPSRVYKGKNEPPMVEYVHIGDGLGS